MLARNRCSHVPSLGRSIVTGLGVLLALISSASPSQSQVLDPHVSVNGKLFDGDGGCSAAPGRCSGPVSFDDVGTYEFFVYIPREPFHVDSMRLALDWPESWSVLDWSACTAVLDGGDPSERRSLLELHFEPCRDDNQALLKASSRPVPTTAANPRNECTENG